ncbi:exoribonuclease R [Synechococcus sp. PROS-7-1]|uniref:RNB domain-containing ribonuclease n=1 Tax=Synechococcus sp. PROS-7-1 TaxID=1442556 RepID=UPI001646BC5A|nr:RNB domain-containing ribonuclease [Synechococcus sp. PROS-7-1]QNI85103.1 exoribonuclease R [Synechococcus sp. PROS-7-1]
MKFTVADLLDQVPFDGTLETAKLEKILRLTNRSEKQSLGLALQALTRLGILSTDDSGDIQRCISDDLVEARLRCSSKGFCFAIRDDGGDDIYIRDHQLNHAWNGDRVLVRITREGGRRRSPEGGVQCILERATTSLLAAVEQQEDKLVAIPLDDRILATIELPSEDAGHADTPADEAVAEVILDRYPVAQFLAQGHVSRALSLNGGPEADRDLMLTKANLHQRSSPPRASLKAPAAKKRLDCTDQPALLLTGWSASDAVSLPAVHVIPHEGGTRLWIHAPAVAERLTPGNSLDQWLLDQAETICLGQQWLPLLSPALTKASAFRVGEIQDAVTLRLDFGPDREWKDWEFSLTKIRPVAEITNEHLAALEGRKPKSRAIPAALKAIKEQISQLETLIFCAKNAHECEKAAGLIELDLPRPQLDTLGDLNPLAPDGDATNWTEPLNPAAPESVMAVLLRTAHRVWNSHSQDLRLPAVLLSAPPADDSALTDVAKAAIALDVPLELDEDGTPSADELAKAVAGCESSRVLNLQLRHALPDSVYRLSDAAATTGSLQTDDNSTDAETEVASSADVDQPASNDAETSGSVWAQSLAPWCCPTLHYADVLNQQVLCHLLNEGKDRPSVRHKDKVPIGRQGVGDQITWPLFTASQDQKLSELFRERIVQRLNTGRRQVSELRKDVVAMAQARSAEPMVNQEQTGVISGVQSYGFFVEIPPSMVEGLVHVSSLNDDWYEYRSRQNRLVGRRSRRVYQLGDQVKVKVLKVDVLRNQIDLEVASNDDSAHDSTEADPLPVAVSDA